MMTERPFLSMVMIARDEEANIEPCFNSWWDHVDEIVLCDTGSTDKTIARAREFAAAKGQLHRLTVTEYEWHDDFAAARNHVDSIASGEWIVWCDLDDVLAGADKLRGIAEGAPANVNAFMFDYVYARDSHNNPVCVLKRERLVRAVQKGRWKGRVHEAQMIDGEVQFVPPSVCAWGHRKEIGAASDRNLLILENWMEEAPDDGRVVQYVGTERAGLGNHEGAVEAFRAYLDLPGQPPEHRCQVWRKLACSLIALERVDEAYQCGIEGLSEYPVWPDSYLTLAQTSYLRGEYDKVLRWAPEVIRIGLPQTLLIVNPLDYTVEPRVALAAALAEKGKLDEAIKVADEALKQRPDHPLLAPAYRGFVHAQKREKTAETWQACAEMLVAHDEQAKALELLETTVPYYAMDHPRIVQARSELRERLRFADNPALYVEHYETGGSKPEDAIGDDRLTSLCERLPRVQFLKRQVEELVEAA